MIDFVQLWVDGSDKDWLDEKNRYMVNSGNESNRWRDWDCLQYWFRGVEKYAPWVRKIHLITPGHFPSWLNRHHKKLNCINQNQLIKKEYIPVFNSNAIELNLHKIESLAEKFVLFCDDMFIIKNTKEKDFFRNNLPCTEAILGCIQPTDDFDYMTANNFRIINKHFRKFEVIRNNIFKWFNFNYGIRNFQTLLLLPWAKFSSMHDSHLPLPHTKHNFEEVWQAEPDILEQTSKSRFRNKENVSHWLFRYWSIMKGEFCPQGKLGKKFEISDDKVNNGKIYDYIKKQRGKIICVNDSICNIDFELRKKELKSAFEAILPDKSEFEI